MSDSPIKLNIPWDTPSPDGTSHCDNFTASAHCPRCGYELTGLVRAYRSSCPLTSRCTECGLDVR